MIVVVDENGKEIDYLEERNNEIKQNLAEVLQDFKKEASSDKKGFKKLGFRLLMQIEEELGKYGIMSADDFVKLDYDDIDYHWKRFHSLLAYYNRFFEIVPNKQCFQLYMRINSRMYRQLQDHDDEDIRNLMLFIEDRFIGKGFSATESGNTDSRATKLRLEAKEHGHSVVSATDEMAISAVTGKSPQELQREVSAILGCDIKMIGGKK